MRKLSVLLVLLAAANSVFGQGGSVSISGGPGMHINSQTTSYAPTAAQAAADCGNAVQMNGSSLTYTLVSPPPSSTCLVWAYNLNATALTISRNGLTINGGTSNITLNQYSGTWIWTDGTNYFSGPLPLVAGANITLTPAANGLTIAASGATNGTYYAVPGSASGNTVTVTANQTTIYGIVNPSAVSVGHLDFNVGTADGATNFSACVYNTSGTLIASTTAAVYASTGLKNVAISQGTVTIPAGRIFIGFTSGGSVLQLMRTDNALTVSQATNGGTSSGGACPGTVTPTADSPNIGGGQAPSYVLIP